MKRHALVTLARALLPTCAFAVDGVVLVNQSTVMAAGGFPYVISNPGSYKLASNLSVTAATDGIHITTSNVSLDLNGFNVASLGPIPGFIETPAVGIQIVGTVSNISIRNGSFVGWSPAIEASFGGTLLTVEDVSIEADFTIGDLTIRNATAVGTNGVRSLLTRVVTDGMLVVTCPAIVTESIGNLIPLGSGCVLSNNSAP